MPVCQTTAINLYSARVIRMAQNLAHKSSLAADEVADLTQEGMVGICVAASRATSFHWPYFSRTARGKMLQFLRDHRFLIHIPAYIQETTEDSELRKDLPVAYLASQLVNGLPDIADRKRYIR